MKKKILILLLLIPFLVSAKEEYSYAWDMEKSSDNSFILEDDNQYYFYEQGINNSKLVTYSRDGKRINTQSINNSDDWEYIYQNNKLNDSFNRYYNRFYNEYDKRIDETHYLYYRAGNSFIQICESNKSCNQYNLEDLSESEIKNYLGDYYFIYQLLENGMFPLVAHINNGYYIVYKFDLNSNDSYLYIYNKDEEKIISYKFNSVKEYPVVDINLNGIYITKSSYDHKNISATYEIVKYNLSGKKEYTEDITDLIKNISNYTDEDLYYNEMRMIDLVNNGVILTLKYNYYSYSIQQCIADGYKPKGNTNEENPSDSTEEINIYSYCEAQIGYRSGYEDQVIMADGDSIEIESGHNYQLASPRIKELDSNTITIKLNMDYAIETKVVEGKGTIKAIGRSASGEGIVFEVVPEKGYVLAEVKVTDANGNVVTFTDYKFTMPSADVLIEARFVPENPNTADILIASTIIATMVIGFCLIKLNKKYKWLK